MAFQITDQPALDDVGDDADDFAGEEVTPEHTLDLAHFTETEDDR